MEVRKDLTGGDYAQTVKNCQTAFELKGSWMPKKTNQRLRDFLEKIPQPWKVRK